ncbi:MAG: hypothetical protein ACPGVO_10195 [Spirulinaceae cyanobacterium]
MGANPLELIHHTKPSKALKNRLHNALKTWLGQDIPWAYLSRLTTGIWMVIAVIQTGEVNLTKWLSDLPCRGLLAQSKQQGNLAPTTEEFFGFNVRIGDEVS